MIDTNVIITILRILIGLLFVGHGSQKLFGWFGGAGLSRHTNMISALGFYPAPFWALVSGLGEFVGGLLLVLGLFTPVGAAAIICSMLVAIIKVHWRNGLWNSNRGYEYNLVILVNAVLIGITHPGSFSLDRFISLPWSQDTVFVVSLAIGLIGVAVGILTTQPQQPRHTSTNTAETA